MVRLLDFRQGLLEKLLGAGLISISHTLDADKVVGVDRLPDAGMRTSFLGRLQKVLLLRLSGDECADFARPVIGCTLSLILAASLRFNGGGIGPLVVV